MNRPFILLVNPWIHDFAAFDLWARPMGLLVLATRLRSAGWEPMLMDCLETGDPKMPAARSHAFSTAKLRKTRIEKPAALAHVPRRYSRYGADPEIIREELASLPVPRAILVTSLMTYWYPGVRETIALLREAYPSVPIVLGGIYASLLPRHACAICGADEVLIGPGEDALGRMLARITGITLDNRPAHHALEFSPALDLLRTVPFLPLLTSRGCPFACAYCASRRLTSVYVRRPVDEVLGEIRSAVVRYGVEDVALYDDAFLVDSRLCALPILKGTAREFPHLRWHSPNGLHAAAIDRETARVMKSAGFHTIRLGLERSSDRFHARTGGKTDFARFLAAVGHLGEAGFSAEEIAAYLLVGLPDQTRGMIEDDVDRVLRTGAHPKLAEYSPIPGTALWEEAVAASQYPIEEEPLFHNCTLLAAAEPGVDGAFLRLTRQRIRAWLDSAPHPGGSHGSVKVFSLAQRR